MDATGYIVAIHRDTGRHVTLPAAYVAEHVDLGYAATIHSAQGRTADTCHVVIIGTESREQLYVAMTRGRVANHVHVALPGASDEHDAIRPDTLVPPTARDLLIRVLDREEATESASTAARTFGNPTRQLSDAIDRYVDSLAHAPARPEAPTGQPAPLPWLPPVPACADAAWDSYLAARARQIADLADAVARGAHQGASPSSALRRRDPTLRAHLELWRATHRDADQRLTPREQHYLDHLGIRTRGALLDDEERWSALTRAVDAHALGAPDYPRLAQQMTRAFNCHIDVDRMLPHLLANRDYAVAPDVLGEVVRQAEMRIALERMAARLSAAQTVRSAMSLPLSASAIHEAPRL